MVDTETHPPPKGQAGEHVFRLGWVLVRRARPGRAPSRRWIYLDTPAAFWKVLDETVRGRQRIYLLAHKIIYDLWVLGGLKGFRDHGYALKSGYANERVVILRFRRGASTLICIDTLNLFPGPLAMWGDEIGLPKLKIDLWRDSDEKVKAYCLRDVGILAALWEHYERFVRENDFGGAALTVSSLAFRAYRHRYMPTPIYLHAHEKALGLERQAYYGGRTECCQVGKLEDRTYTIHDVNSMYPCVMRDGTYPVRFVGYYRGCTVKELSLILGTQEAVASVGVHVREPIVPYRSEKRVIYPIGDFDTVLAGPELRLLLASGGVRSVHRVAAYDRGKPFTGYVNELYALRQRYAAEGKTLWASLVKLMLNGLYGKFGQESEIWKHYPNTMGVAVGAYRFTGMGMPGVNYMICLGDEIWVRVGKEEGASSFPAIAAYVTSYARVKLWDYLLAAGMENVIYYDTDSLVTMAAGTRRLQGYVDAARLGALKREYTGRGGWIRASKDYCIGDKKRIKGVSASAIKVGTNKYLDTYWPGFWGLLAAGVESGYATGQVVKVLKREYTKGRVLESGRIVPLELGLSPLPAVPP